MPSHVVNASLQAVALGALSNILAQLISAYRGGRPVSLDIAEFARFLIFQLLTAPMNVKFQQLLEYAFPAHDYRQPQPQGISQAKHKRDDLESQDKRTGRSAQWLPTQQHQPLQRRRRLDYWANTMAKWFLDCISLGMFVNTLAFLLIMGVLKGQSAHQISVNVQEELAPIIFAGYRVWPVASFISFTCVPLERRIAWLSLVGLLWGVYMSLVAERV